MTEPSNPWVERLNGLKSAQAIEDLCWKKTEGLGDLYKLSPEDAFTHIQIRLKEVFIPTTKVVSSISAIVGYAQIGAVERYAGEADFIRRVHSSSDASDVKSSTPLLLPGLNGLGKSAMMSSLLRLMPQKNVSVKGVTTPVRLRSPYIRSFSHGDGASRFLKDLSRSLGLPTSDREVIARRAYLEGVPLLGLDELQHIAITTNAVSTIADVIMSATSIGVPVVACCNYSMVHQLVRATPQIRDRTISLIREYDREDPGDDGWAEICAAQGAMFSRSFGQNLADHAETLWERTAGIPRYLALLLASAYLRMRERTKRRELTVADVISAFGDRNYGVARILIAVLEKGRARATAAEYRSYFLPDELAERKVEENATSEIPTTERVKEFLAADGSKLSAPKRKSRASTEEELKTAHDLAANT